jgi:small subunit ribosomal protein S1
MTSDANDKGGQEPTPPEGATPDSPGAESPDAGRPRRRILIGSQRDPAAYKPKPKRDWIPIGKSGKEKRKRGERRRAEAGSAPAFVAGEPEAPAPPPPAEPLVVLAMSPETSLPDQSGPPVALEEQIAAPPAEIFAPLEPPVAPGPSAAEAEAAEAGLAPALEPGEPSAGQPPSAIGDRLPAAVSIEAAEFCPASVAAAMAETISAMPPSLAPGKKKFPPPNIRDRLPPDLEQEFQEAVGDLSIDTLIAGSEAVSAQPALEPESRHSARVVAVGRDDVFVELGGREQGILPLKLFGEPPQPGTPLEVVILRFNHEDGLYEVTLPLAAAEVGDWSQVAEGMLVDARVTGHNAGGLECEVNRLRGFIPVSQIGLYRVENLEEFVEQKFTCLVTEADPARRNLVLSRRAVLEREREEARRTMFESLAPGQIREGIVRKLVDFGAFVELGSGVDGLLHVSQLGWGRVKHPSEVVQEGQKIRIRVEKVDKDNGRISLSYRDLLENPWTGADQKYLVNSVVRGKVVKLMDFGAFVELEPGVEGLVHISELSHKRVPRVSDVVKEGDEIEAVVLSVDPKARRISLSMKNVNVPPEPEAKPQAATQEPPAKPKPAKRPAKPLLGGLGRSPKK